MICSQFKLCLRATGSRSPEALGISILTRMRFVQQQRRFRSSMCARSDPRTTFDLVEGVESLYGYRPGGYHPVIIGDSFRDGRYNIVHKLGHGTYSTVWLARDNQTRTYAAIKIGIAAGGPSRDIGILKLLAQSDGLLPPHPGRNAIPPLLDSFVVSGPNGNHDCIVTSPARMPISGAKEAYKSLRLFQLPVARAIAAQLAQGVAFMHSRGIVHADLHQGNILLGPFPALDPSDTDQLYSVCSAPYEQQVRMLDRCTELAAGVPDRVYAGAFLSQPSHCVTIEGARVLLTDFGEAFDPINPGSREPGSRTPNFLAPPEARFVPGAPISFPADIWGLASAIWGCLANHELFEGITWTDITEDQILVAGDLPAEWAGAWDEMRRKDSMKGSMPADWVDDPEEPPRTLEFRWDEWVQEPRREAGMQLVEPEEKKAFFRLIRSMAVFRPEDRINAQQVLESDWMRDWALPELAAMGSNY
ncbi:CMGC/SRPK protein kinase [Gaeumannomyces tritici R3-111a-1]|uniref:non-specific serine/threonine protein kinase n=1 Tax=Gaeumannomyces tritici (strain R3-111a-1) TaxID=644352 RepID=J3NN74_GAET3|nr:CMGC/SRPK protein kinase [Gaeumannomyces tritici R3-111a-1]EJT77626.1 CMGC/SRPK protein kinase [Gaeumannomyces tritici R3-111a-1]